MSAMKIAMKSKGRTAQCDGIREEIYKKFIIKLIKEVLANEVERRCKRQQEQGTGPGRHDNPPYQELWTI